MLLVGEFLERLQDFAAAGIDILVSHGRYYTLHHGQVTWGVIPIAEDDACMIALARQHKLKLATLERNVRKSLLLSC